MNLDNTQAKNINIMEYAKSLGANFENVGGKWRCCCLLHQEKTPSMYYNPTTNKLRCFGGCGKSWDVIDLCKDTNNITYIEAVKKLTEGFTGGNIDKRYINNQKAQQEAQEEEIKKKLKALEIAKKFAKPLRSEEKQYLKDRGILGIIEKINNNKNIPLKVMANEYKGIKSILYMYEGKNLIIKKYYRQQDIEKGFPKVKNIGFAKPIALMIDKNNPKIAIVEGIADALSVLAMNRNVIVLNGVSNVNKLIQGLKGTWAKNQIFVPIMDNDKAGNKAQAQLIEALKTLNLQYEVPTKLIEQMQVLDLKDMNDYLIYKMNKKRGNM